MIISRKSLLTGRVHELSIDITPEQYSAWIGGELIQDVMPELGEWEREFLISGATRDEWIKFFGSEETNV